MWPQQRLERDTALLDAGLAGSFELEAELYVLRRQVTELARSRAEQDRTLRLLREIAEGTATAIGEEFFRELVRHLAKALDVRYALVAELTEVPGRVRTLASWACDRFLDEYEYDVKGTPCEPVLTGRITRYVHSISTHFPRDKMLLELGIESYLAIPLIASGGGVEGHLVVMDDKPMPENPLELETLKIFAARAAAELQRLRAEADLRRAQARVMQAEKVAVL